MMLPGAAGGRVRELATRVVVGAGLAVVTLGCLLADRWTWAALIGVAIVLAWREWAGLVRVPKAELALSSVLLAAWVGIVTLDPTQWWYIVVVFGAVIFRPKHRSAESVARLANQGILYVAVPAFALVVIRQLPDGVMWIAYVFAVVWSADVAAYAVGRLVGGPKLWPRISPAKTWAGFAGACLAAMAASVAVWSLIAIGGAGSASNDTHYQVPLRAAIAGLLLGALAQGGDLFESWLKRRAGVKDSGTLLPGHGGVLDRLDSLIPVAPAVAGAVWLGWL